MKKMSGLDKFNFRIHEQIEVEPLASDEIYVPVVKSVPTTAKGTKSDSTAERTGSGGTVTVVIDDGLVKAVAFNGDGNWKHEDYPDKTSARSRLT